MRWATLDRNTAEAFRACRKLTHWITYRRAPKAAPTRLPFHTTTIKDYGPARFKAVLKQLTTERDVCVTHLAGAGRRSSGAGAS